MQNFCQVWRLHLFQWKLEVWAAQCKLYSGFIFNILTSSSHPTTIGWRGSRSSHVGQKLLCIEILKKIQKNILTSQCSSYVTVVFPEQVHSNNMFYRGVKIFSSVSCSFKPRLIATWEAEPVEFRTVLDDRNPSARYVTVPLGRRNAKALRCRFHFADVWMMFSEISFQSGRRGSREISTAKAWFTSFLPSWLTPLHPLWDVRLQWSTSSAICPLTPVEPHQARFTGKQLKTCAICRNTHAISWVSETMCRESLNHLNPCEIIYSNVQCRMWTQVIIWRVWFQNAIYLFSEMLVN